MAAKTMVGARALVYVGEELVGLFDSIDYSVNIGNEPIHILGRFGPVEITPTSYEAVTLNCSGFRVIGQGVHLLPKFPKTQDLLNLESVTIAVLDRQQADGSEPILVASNCIPTSYGTGYGARATTRIRISYIGTVVRDESGDQNEAGAATLP